ncbi:MAG: tetratricopeptide repeat protein [Planctomycetia bacterium]|nr:tetratricopeptide repeat protein [Planctomycetia bacterium]
MSEERRTVVIMFARVDGLAELPESERARHADGVFSRLRGIIEARGGALDKFIGDVVMALWGAPVAHEDDAARAARAAVLMADETARYADESGLPLSLRAGLNLGEVLFGSVGGDRPTAMGDPVNVAQRLMAGARAGTIVVSRALADAAGRGVRARALPPMELKGRAEPVEVLEIVADDEARTSLRVVPDLATPIQGREAELAELTSRLGAAAGATAVCIALTGEPGIGKSRLAAEARRRLRAGTPAFRSYVGPMSPDAPFHGPATLVREALAAGAPGLGAEDPLGPRVFEALAASVPREPERRALAGLLLQSVGAPADGWGADALDPARVLPETLRAWSLVLGSLAADGPAILVFEDIHAADEGSRELLKLLPSALARRPVALLATTRPDAPPPPDWDVMALKGIGRRELAAVASQVLGSALAPDLEEFLAARSEGNPLFALELARYLRENNLAGGSPSRLLVAPARLPNRLTSLLTARLDGLPPSARAAVKVASVLGREFSAPQVSRVSGHDASNALHLAASRRIVSRISGRQPSGEDEWSFQHALVRDAAYQLLTKRERKSLHERAADDLEPLAAADPRRAAPAAARHREQAGQVPEAAALWGQAARAGLRQKAWLEAAAAAEEAIRLGNGALRTVASDALAYQGRMDRAMTHLEAALADPAATGPRRGAALRSLSRVLSRRGHFEESRAAAAEAEPLDSDPTAIQESLIWQASALERLGRPAEALEALDRAPAAAGSHEGLWRERAACLTSLGRYDEARALLERAVASAESAGDRWSAALAMNTMGLADLRSKRAADSVRWFERAAEAFRDTADRAGLATSLSNLGIALSESDRNLDAEAHYRESLGIRREIGDLAGVFSSLSNLAIASASRGDLEGALTIAREAAEIASRLKNPMLNANALVLAGNIEFRRGALSAARDAYAGAHALLSRVADPAASAAVCLNLGLVHVCLRCGSAATPFLQESLRRKEALGHMRETVGIRELLAQSRFLAGDIAGALDAVAPILRNDGAALHEHTDAGGVVLRILVAAGRDDEPGAYATAVRGAVESGRLVESTSILSLAMHSRRRGDRAAARHFARAALQGARTPGGASAEIEASLLLAALELEDGSAAEAGEIARASREVAQRAGDRAGEGLALLIIARTRARADRPAEAREAFEQGRALLSDIADPAPRIECLVALALTAAELGDDARARDASGEARRLAMATGLPGLLFDLRTTDCGSDTR